MTFQNDIYYIYLGYKYLLLFFEEVTDLLGPG